MSIDYTRGDSPAYDGCREAWASQLEEELQARIDELEAEQCPGCLPDGLCRRMPDGAAEQLRGERAAGYSGYVSDVTDSEYCSRGKSKDNPELLEEKEV